MPIKDALTLAGARKLAKQITEIWKTRGYAGIAVDVALLRTYDADVGDDVRIYTVRSNIGPRGFPPIVKERADTGANPVGPKVMYATETISHPPAAAQ